MGKYAADPKAPKRPATGYFRYMAETRDSVSSSNPGYGVAQIMKVIGAAWSRLSNAKKQGYNDAAAKQKSKYDKQVAKYKATPGYTKWLEGKITHKKAEKAAAKRNELKAMLPNKPQRPHSAYMLFAAKARKKFSGAPTEVMALIGKAWGQASASEKGKFQKQHDTAQAKYDKAMAKYVETGEYKTYEVAFQAHKTELYKVKTYGSVAAANKANRTRLAARAKKQKEREQAAKARARKAAIRA